MGFLPNNKFLTLLLFSIFIFFNSCSSDDETLAVITVSAEDFIVTIDEKPLEGQILGTVQGSTSQGSVSFSITEQSVDNCI